MPSGLERLSTYVRRPENVSIFTAIVLAVPAGLLGETVLHWEGLGFALFIAIGVIVPSTYREQWRGHRSPIGAVAWTAVASAIVGAGIVGGALLLGTAGGQSEVVASIVAFTVTTLGGSLLALRVGGSD